MAMKSSSAMLFFLAFPNDPVEHLLCEYNMQMMQLELQVAELLLQQQAPVILP